ncbi:ubiquitinyl hydrolase 1 [Ranunculus cassubicifolius]
MELGDVYDDEKGYVVNDVCIVEAEVEVCKEGVVSCWKDDSKTETSYVDDLKIETAIGYVGLKNQGATCYMNSLLQTLFHIPCFRKAVYCMPIVGDGGMPLALQTLFYKLQCKGRSVGTKALTKSFGWDSSDSFLQHDVQELNRVLCEKLEDRMKGTVVEGKTQELFEGHHMNYIECIDVDYKSTRKESYYDIQLDVKGCRDIYASFDKYVEVERMDGDNKYRAEEHGLQDAKKGVLFVDFPPVLQLQLKRFEYDFMKDTMVKINDKYEFPLTLDLDRENGKYLSPDSDRGIRNLYTLHSVLVHRGGVYGGHYYVFIQPTLSDQWFKFDDVNVTKEDRNAAVEEQYGGDDFFHVAKCSSAYMLVYIRDSDKDKILCEVDENDIADDLRMRLKLEKEEKEKKKKEIAEAHLYTTIKVARDEDFVKQIGRDKFSELVDHDKVHSFRVLKKMSIKDLKELVAGEFGVPVELTRFWLWAKHWKQDCRPYRPMTLKPMTLQQESKSVGGLEEWEKKLFLEVERGLDSCPIALPNKTPEDYLLFFKLYDPKMERLQYVGRLLVSHNSKPIHILPKLNEMAGFSPGEEIDLYDEASFVPIKKEKNFYINDLADGDILFFQRSVTAETKEEFRHPDVPSFLGYLSSLKMVNFRSLVKPEEDDICLELSLTATYDEVVEKLASHLGLDAPTKIRLTPPGSSNPVKYRGVKSLSDILLNGFTGKLLDIISYEVLDIPLPEVENLVTIEVTFNHSTLSISLPKQSSIGDLIHKMKAKVGLSRPNADIRLFTVLGHKIHKLYQSTDIIEGQCIYYLHGEEIPKDEVNLGPNDYLVQVCHIVREQQYHWGARAFGVPFLFGIHKKETLLEVKGRIQKNLQVEDEEFSKWRFAIISCYEKHYLEDSDDFSRFFFRRNDCLDMSYAGTAYLGLEHFEEIVPQIPNKSRLNCDKSIKICN